MLKKKLDSKRKASDGETKQIKVMEEDVNNAAVITSIHFAAPFWKQFYDLECELNAQVKMLKPPSGITHTYNPVEYAGELHCAYLRRYLNGPKHLLFVGMNPGPNGMGQTGIPFGNVKTVREFMQLSGLVQQPPRVHPKRPITGLERSLEEPSGVRIWTLLKDLANGSLDVFGQQCFVHNFCPLIFLDKDGKNITPSELKGEYKTQIRDICLKITDQLIELVQPDIIVAVGKYVYDTFGRSKVVRRRQLLQLPHPSPRSLNNQNWPEKAETFLYENDLVKYIKNEI